MLGDAGGMQMQQQQAPIQLAPVAPPQIVAPAVLQAPQAGGSLIKLVLLACHVPHSCPLVLSYAQYAAANEPRANRGPSASGEGTSTGHH